MVRHVSLYYQTRDGIQFPISRVSVYVCMGEVVFVFTSLFFFWLDVLLASPACLVSCVY
jgi:hypothetical protein